MILENWTIEDVITFENQELNLQGAAVRTMLFVKMYVLSFYATKKITNSEAAIETQIPKNLQLIINTDMINAPLIVLGFKASLKKTSYGRLDHISNNFEKMFHMFEQFPLKKGDRIDLFFNGQDKLCVYFNNELKLEEFDIDAIKAIYGIWFNETFDEKIRKALIGQ